MDNVYAVSRFLLSGSGGQGVITMAILLAEAAVKHEGLVAVQSQSYGPEARGGATRSDVILSHQAIHYPNVEQPNVLVALTDTACGSPVQGYTALEHASWAPRLDRFVQHHRPWRPRHADRRGPHRIHRKGTGRAFPLGASRGQQKRPASWGGTGGTPA